MYSRKSKEEIDKILAEHEESGLSRKQFCEENDIKLGTFQSWIVKRKQTNQIGSFVKIQNPVISSPSKTINYQLEIGSNILLVPPGFNVSEVKDLIDLMSC